MKHFLHPSKPVACKNEFHHPRFGKKFAKKSAKLLSTAACTFSLLASMTVFGSFVLPTSAQADLRLCNKTGSRIGVSVGYKDENGWATEGWWNIQSNACKTLLSGELISRFYYIHAVDYDLGGNWSGKVKMCTQNTEFTIYGIEDCKDRGFEVSGFAEIDTGDEKNWTVQLTEPATKGTGGQ